MLTRICAAHVAGEPVDRLIVVQRCPPCGASDHGQPSLREFLDCTPAVDSQGGAGQARGIVTDLLTAVDLSRLPLGEATAISHRWHDLYVLDWSHASGTVLGAAIAADPPELHQLDEGQA